MDDKSLISKFFKRLIMVSIHVSCVGTQVENKIHLCVSSTPTYMLYIVYTTSVYEYNNVLLIIDL